MAILSKPTNLSTEGNLLYEILKKLDELVKVTNKIVTTVQTTTAP